MGMVATDSKCHNSHASMRSGNGSAMLHTNDGDTVHGPLVTSSIILAVSLAAFPNASFTDHRFFGQFEDRFFNL